MLLQTMAKNQTECMVTGDMMAFMVDTSSSLQVLTAMITPAVLISACGTLIFSTSTRLSRVVDRVRSLAAQLQSEPPNEGDQAMIQQNIMLEQLSSVARRVVLLRSAMTCFYIATGLFVATSIAVGVITITRLDYGWIAFVLALCWLYSGQVFC